MFLLDNNAFKLAGAGEEHTMRRVRENIDRVWLSSVAAEEILTGRLSGISRAQSPRNSLSLPQAHDDFVKTLEDLRTLPILVYSREADAFFQEFPPAIIRVGPQDCRIAAQAIAHKMTVVTRNLRDFEAIGVSCVDWSVPYR